MPSLLSIGAQAQIKKALQSVVDTFFKEPVVLNKRVTVPDKYGETPVSTVTQYNFIVLSEYSVGKSARYENIEKTDFGQREQPSFHVFFWKQDLLDAGITIDEEADTITLDEIEYEIRLSVPSALFADLGYLLQEVELKLVGGE